MILDPVMIVCLAQGVDGKRARVVVLGSTGFKRGGLIELVILSIKYFDFP